MNSRVPVLTLIGSTFINYGVTYAAGLWRLYVVLSFYVPATVILGVLTYAFWYVMFRMRRGDFLVQAPKGPWFCIRRMVDNWVRAGVTPDPTGIDLVSAVKAKIATWKVMPIKAHESTNPHSLHATVRSRAQAFMKDVAVKYAAKTGTDGRIAYLQGGVEGPGVTYLIDPVDIGGRTSTAQCDGAKILGLVDVDYYVDMSRVLTGQHAMVYTFCPLKSSDHGSGGAAYHFESNELVFMANSGYEARHSLWNYGADYCTVKGWFYDHVYRVISVDMGHDRVLRFMCHVATYSSVLRHLRLTTYRHFLRRHVFNFGNITAFQYWDHVGGLRVAIGRCGQSGHGFEMSHDHYTMLCSQARIKGALSLHNIKVATGLEMAWELEDVIGRLVESNAVLDTVQRGHLCASVVESPGAEPPKKEASKACDGSTGCDLHGKDFKYLTKGSSGEPVVKLNTGLQVVGEQTTAKAPVRTKATLVDAVAARVTKCSEEANALLDQSKLSKASVRNVIYKGVMALLRPFLGGAELIALKDADIVDRVRPIYKEKVAVALQQQLSMCPELRATRPFVKSEAHAEVKDPRVITPLHDVVQAHMYRYAYVVQDLLHACAWFAFGRPTKDVSDHIGNMSRDALSRGFVCYETDYSRYDGHFTAPVRQAEFDVYRKLFGRTCKGHLSELFKGTFDIKLTGAKARSGAARCSGAPDTCLMNSLVNMAIMRHFCEQAGLGAAHAEKYCVVGGDDGLLFAPPGLDKDLNRCAAEFGFVLKVVVRSQKDAFSFLGRWFMWADTVSMGDPARILPKMNVIRATNPVDRYPRLVLKLESLLMNDPNTPVLSGLIRARLAEARKEARGRVAQEDDAYWSRFLKTLGPWPNVARPWMNEVVQRQSPAKVGDVRV
jgi:hypothetical protein